MAAYLLRVTGLHEKCVDPRCVFARKCGRRGGVMVRAKLRRFNPLLPSTTLFNARSLDDKMEELSACLKFKNEFRDSCVMCVTETWLDLKIPDNTVEFETFKTCRTDRTPKSGKSRGGDVFFYVNNKWCSQVATKQQACTPYYELLFVTCRHLFNSHERVS